MFNFLTSPISFPGLGIEINPSDGFSIGNFTIKWYGVIIAVGVLLASVYILRRVKQFGLNEDDILILAGSIPKSLPQDTYERLLARLQGRGVRAVVDATRDLLVNVLQYHPFLIKPNNHELGEIVGKVLKTEEEIIAAARTLQEKGARNVLVSMAGDGALLVDEQGQVHRIGCPKGKVVNSVGAGDSMVAGFVAGWMQTRSYSFALRLGTACGSATAFSLGLATKEKIDELMKEI